MADPSFLIALCHGPRYFAINVPDKLTDHVM